MEKTKEQLETELKGAYASHEKTCSKMHRLQYELTAKDKLLAEAREALIRYDTGEDAKLSAAIASIDLSLKQK